MESVRGQILKYNKSYIIFEVIYPLDIPSVGQTGIKLIHPFEIIPGYITELTLDFDVQHSIIETGNGEYKLKPVIGIISSYSQDELAEIRGSNLYS